MQQLPLLQTILSTHISAPRKAKLTRDELNAFENIKLKISELSELSLQCTKDCCLTFLLSTSLKKVKFTVLEMISSLQESFNTLGIKDASELLTLSEADATQQDIVDMKRICLVLTSIKNKNREDAEESLRERFASLAEYGISAEEIESASITIPDLPDNLQLKINRADYITGRKIGRGQSGDVFLGKNAKTGAIVAIKKLHKERFSQRELESYQREIFALSALSHPCLLKFIGYTDDAPYLILTEYMANGCLFDVLRTKPQSLSPTDRSLIALDIARGLSYLHEKGVIHRDMKSLNILLDSTNRARICDFGMARLKASGEPMTGMIGTAHWMAPEVLLSSPKYDEKVDVYGFAMLMWELLTSKQPYEGMNPSEIATLVADRGLRPEIPAGTPSALAGLIEKCWSGDPMQRPPMKRIVQSLLQEGFHFVGTDEQIFKEDCGVVKEQQRLALQRFRTPTPPVHHTQHLTQELLKEMQNGNSRKDLLMEALFRMLEVDSDRETVVKSGGYQIINSALQDALAGKEREAGLACLHGLSKTIYVDVFNIDVLKSLLEFNECSDKELVVLALRCLVRAADLKFDFVASSPSFLYHMLCFLKRPIPKEHIIALFRAANRILNSYDSSKPPDRVWKVLLWAAQNVPHAALISAGGCLAAMMRFKQIRASLTEADFFTLLSDSGLHTAIVAYAEADEPETCDAKLVEQLKLQIPLEGVVDLFGIVCALPRFTASLLPFSELGTYATEAREATMKQPVLRQASLQAYNALALLLEEAPDDVVMILRSADANHDLDASKLPAALVEHLLKRLAAEDVDCIGEMGVVYRLVPHSRSPEFQKLVQPLALALTGNEAALRMPAFLCLSELPLDGVLDVILPPAAFFVNSDNEFARDAARDILIEHVAAPEVDLVRTVTIFTDGVKLYDSVTKDVVTAIGVACKTKPLPDELRQKMSQIFQKL